MRVVVALSAIWVLAGLGLVGADYFLREPQAEHYFWVLPGGALDLFATIKNLEPKVPQILFVLLGPLPAIWVVGCLIAWVKNA